MSAEEEYPSSIGTFFLDSGAHSLYNKEVRGKGEGAYKFYSLKEGSEFRAYVDSYAAFVKKFGWAIDYYVNVDAIFNPEITWEVQGYLENEHGLNPIPVIHYGTDIKWVEKYIEKHPYIGIGGLGQEITKAQYFYWADRVFDFLCPSTNQNKPTVKTHGFAMSSWELMRRYPWFSVDSASWIKAASYGRVMVPHKRNGVFTFDEQPYTIAMSNDSPDRSIAAKHILTCTKSEQAVIHEWLEIAGVKLGKMDKDGKEIERGVLTHFKPRARCNLVYFQGLCDSLPKYPRAFKASYVKGFFDV